MYSDVPFPSVEAVAERAHLRWAESLLRCVVRKIAHNAGIH